jgi:hypothetical protein
MRPITFKDIHKVGQNILETETFKHIHYPEMLSRNTQWKSMNFQ